MMPLIPVLWRAIRAAVIVVAAVLTWAAPARAHPHAWFDVTVEVLFGDNGRITALRQTWRLDEFYTAFAIEGMPLGDDGQPTKEALAALLQDNLSGLSEYGYFTTLRAGERRLTGSTVEAAWSRLPGPQLEMGFTLVLPEPIDAGRAPLTYAVSDPTYYIDMRHIDGADGVSLVKAPDGCRAQLHEPTPSDEQIAFAASLDKTESGGDGLGDLFAERVVIRCD